MDDFIYTVDLAEGYVEFECGWRSPIVWRYDEDGDYAIDDDEVCSIVVRVPEGFICLDADPDNEGPENFATFH